MTGRNSFLIFIRGVCMGAADIIPGVSGGTIALITGIYPRLIRGVDDAILHGGGAAKKILRGEIGGAKDDLLKIDIALFVPLIFGIGLSFLTLSHLIHYLLEHRTALLYAFFFGLIFSSALFVLRSISKFNATTVLAFAAGSVFAFVFVGMNPVGANHHPVVVVCAGALAICAMLLPGISGSFLLVFLGQYDYMLTALKEFRISVMLVFIFGALGGLASFTRLIDYLLNHHRPVTLAFITGLMAGSLRLPYLKIRSAGYSLVPVVVCGVVGLSVVFVLEYVFSESKTPE